MKRAEGRYYDAMHNPPFPQESGALTLDGPVGPLDVVVDLPEADVAVQPVVAIVCHPLSTEGGSMHNKVVTIAARALRDLGIATVRFNFRSVGESAGSFDNGVGEQDDLKAVAAWVRAQRPGQALWLAGFSFGAYVSVRAAGVIHVDVPAIEKQRLALVGVAQRGVAALVDRKSVV